MVEKIIPGLGAAKDTELFNLSKLSLELHWLPQFGSFNLAPPVLEIFWRLKLSECFQFYQICTKKILPKIKIKFS